VTIEEFDVKRSQSGRQKRTFSHPSYNNNNDNSHLDIHVSTLIFKGDQNFMRLNYSYS